ncbi:hypothetical protein BD779DRAFT_583570 [Infundibulicybe gibba]|nr:hypothetical protein BD779DRAFT_583570 [Infundibulicybe gibba]
MATPTPDIGQTFGAMFVGGLITMAVYGITTLQMYFYFIYYPKDSLGLKALVATIWTLDTLHVVLMCHSLHTYLILGFGNPRVLVNGTWSLFASIAVNSRLLWRLSHKGSPIHSGNAQNSSRFPHRFFTLRIYQLSRRRIKWVLSSVIGFAVFAHFCFGIETVIYFFMITEFSRLNEATFKSALPFAITAILSDVLIAAALCFLLERSRTDFEDTNSLITKLVVFAINRCVLTSAVAVVEVIVFITKPHSFYSFAIDFIIGKLYANSLLATLNSRQSLRRKTSEESSDGISTSFNIASVATGPGHISLDEIATQDSADNYRRRPLDTANKQITGSSRTKHSFLG